MIALLMLLAVDATPGNALATRGGQLITVNAPDARRHDCEEWYAVPNAIEIDAGRLAIYASITQGEGPALDLRITQEPAGHVDIEAELSIDGYTIALEHLEGERYADIAGRKLFRRNTVADVLAELADGMPPADVDAIAAASSTAEAEPTAETIELIGQLDADDWRKRGEAAATLAGRLPELRAAGRQLELSDGQRSTIELLLKLPPAGPAIVEAIAKKHLLPKGGFGSASAVNAER